MNRSSYIVLIVFFNFLAIGLSAVPVPSSSSSVILVSVEDTITGATFEVVDEAIEVGVDMDAEAVVIILDTPGGQLDATMKIVESIEGSVIPVVSYVYPKGAKAWSAGTLILMASHVAAMAPHTVIGSAQPVSYSPIGGSEPVEEDKVLNALSLFMAERARMHGRNETAARLFVEENLNLNSVDAHRMKVVEVLASNLDELFIKIDGFTVATSDGVATLKTRGAPIVEHSPSLRLSILAAISNPLLAYLLFTVGLYALAFGLASPGYGGEVIGAVALLTGLIGLGFDINLGALLIAGLGAVLMIAEAYTPGFGILGGAGLFCLVMGGILIIPFTPSKWLIAPEWYNYFASIALGVAAIIGGFTLFMVYKILQARRKRPVMGGVIGAEVEAVDEMAEGETGFVRYKGEYWKARAEERVKAGSKCSVVDKDGPILIVKPCKKGQ